MEASRPRPDERARLLAEGFHRRDERRNRPAAAERSAARQQGHAAGVGAAAAAGDPQAALMLGATFDPVVLRDLGVLGFSPDPAQARTWYQRAADAGLPEATRRLERLVKMAR